MILRRLLLGLMAGGLLGLAIATEMSALTASRPAPAPEISGAEPQVPLSNGANPAHVAPSNAQPPVVSEPVEDAADEPSDDTAPPTTETPVAGTAPHAATPGSATPPSTRPATETLPENHQQSAGNLQEVSEQVVWDRFSRAAAARGFATFLSAETGLRFATRNRGAGRHAVVFEYTDQAQLDAALPEIRALTGRLAP